MKPIDRTEILPLGEYENVRDQFRNRVIVEKKLRRFSLGPKLTGVFENRDTVLMQIQEMLRTERITREAAIEHEIATYNELLPGVREVSATMMIEIDDKAERDAFLLAAKGIERALRLTVNSETTDAIVNPTRELDDRASAVIYVKWPVSEASAAAIKAGGASMRLAVKHAAYEASADLSAENARGLAEDFVG